MRFELLVYGAQPKVKSIFAKHNSFFTKWIGHILGLSLAQTLKKVSETFAWPTALIFPSFS